MKRIILLTAFLTFALTSCGDIEETDPVQTNDAVNGTLTEQKVDQSSQASEKETENSGENPKISDFKYSNVHQNPYELEIAIKETENEFIGSVDDSEFFEKIEDMRNSIWARYYSDKTGLPIEKLTPEPMKELQEAGCVAHLDCYYLGYTYKDKKFEICVVDRKFDSIDEVYNMYFGDDGAFSLKSDNVKIQKDMIIDEYSEYTNGYLLFKFNSNGIECQITASDKDVTLDELKEFAEAIVF